MSNTQLQKAAPQTPAKTIKDLLLGPQFKEAVSQSLPKHLTPDRFCAVALTTIQRSEKLMKCSQTSLFNALKTLSQFGLELDGRRAHLVPFGTDCTLIIDYKGLAELAYRSGLVSYVHADVICENDEFEYDLGEIKKHKVDFRKDRGPAYAVFAMCRFKDGSAKFEVMTVAEVEALKERSSGYQAFVKGYTKSNPWETDWREMAKKTTFRRLSKWLPLSPEFRDAVEAEDTEAARFGAATPVFAADSSFLAPPSETTEPAAAESPSEPEALSESVIALADFVCKDEGATFDDFQLYADGETLAGAGDWTGFQDVPEAMAKGLIGKGKSALQSGLRAIRERRKK